MISLPHRTQLQKRSLPFSGLCINVRAGGAGFQHTSVKHLLMVSYISYIYSTEYFNHHIVVRSNDWTECSNFILVLKYKIVMSWLCMYFVYHFIQIWYELFEKYIIFLYSHNIFHYLINLLLYSQHSSCEGCNFCVLYPISVTCDRLSNCSGHGKCVRNNLCRCTDGYFGASCDSSKTPVKFISTI